MVRDMKKIQRNAIMRECRCYIGNMIVHGQCHSIEDGYIVRIHEQAITINELINLVLPNVPKVGIELPGQLRN